MKKILSNKGLTLIESVITLLAATIVTALFLVLVNFASSTYITMQEASQGQVLCSNLTNTIQDELRYATQVELDNSDSKCNFTYYSQTINVDKKCKLVCSDRNSNRNKVYIKYNNKGKYDYYGLVGNESYVFNLEADIECIYDKTNKIFNCKVIVSDYKSGNEIVTSEFVVKPLNKGKL